MARRASSFRGRSGISESQRRKKTWTGFVVGTGMKNGFSLPVPAAPDNSESLALIFFPADGTAALSESTLLRIRGTVSIPKSTPASPVNTVVAFGIAMVTNEAAAAGSVPNPATVFGADWDGWLFYRSTVLDTVETQAGIFDAKAMRKFNGGTSLVFVGGAATDTGTGFPGGDILVCARGLFLLAWGLQSAPPRNFGRKARHTYSSSA